MAQLGQLTGQVIKDFDPAGYEAAAQPAGMPGSLEMAVERGLAHAPSMRRLAFETEAADADIASKRSAYLPQLSLRLESSHGVASDNRALLMLLAQPGAGLSARSGVDAAIARREATRLARQAAEREARERVELDWNEWSAAQGRVENAERTRASSAEVAESYARQYAAGRKSWLDVLNAVRENTQAELALADARGQMQAAALRLKVLTGMVRLENND